MTETAFPSLVTPTFERRRKPSCDGKSAKRHELKNPFFTFGKDDDCDVRIGGWGAPRIAAIVIREEQGFRLMDVSPKADAVTLNGKDCRDKHLSDSDTFEVKGKTWRFFFGAAGDLR